MTTASTSSTPRRGGGIRWDQLVWGGGLLVFGVAWFVDVAAGVSVPYAVVAAATLIAVGDVEIDLRAVRVATPTAVAADLGVGDLVVRVPAETAIEVDGDVGIGEIVVFGDQRGGVGVTVHRRDGPSSETRVLRLDTSVGIGRVEVTR